MSRQYDSYGRDQHNVENVWGNAYFQSGDQRTRDEQILLMAVKDEVDSRLYQSLHNAVFLNLEKEAQPDQVKCSWDREIKVGSKALTTLSDDTTIAQIFDAPDIKGKLLILGQPGAGKTTMLLDLAKFLVEKAEADSNYPLPVLFNLSSWQDERQLIRDWLVAELKSKYGVSTKLGQRWVLERMLLPLLDGLDEVAPERQEMCAQRLNAFLTGESSPIYIVVCSRIAEYENYETTLQLNGAIFLKALSNQQIQTYLTNAGRDELWHLLCHSTELMAFMRTPLLLSMAVLAYPKDVTTQWKALPPETDQCQYLLEAYIKQMLHRAFESHAYRTRKIPSAKQTRWWLSYLARQMEKTSQTEFLIEVMQPSMLPKNAERRYRMILGLLHGLLCGLAFGLSGGLSLGLSGGLFFGLSGGLSLGLFFGLLCGLFFWSRFGLDSTIRTVEVFHWSWAKAQSGLNSWLSLSLSSGMLGGLAGGLFFWLLGRFKTGLIGQLIQQLGLGLLVGLLVGLFGRLRTGQLELIFWLLSGLFLGLLLGLLVVLIGGLSGGLSGSLSVNR